MATYNFEASQSIRKASTRGASIMLRYQRVVRPILFSPEIFSDVFRLPEDEVSDAFEAMQPLSAVEARKMEVLSSRYEQRVAILTPKP